jgi:methyltransferase
VSLSLAVLALVTVQRIGELALARRNTARLKTEGAVEAGAGHYPAIVALHAAWLIGLWLLAWDVPPNNPLLFLFGVLQVLRVWVLASLGRRWTTRILVLPGQPLVRTGLYRWLRHPNYAVVVAEIAVLPLAFGLVWYALVFSALNAGVLAIRIKAENEAIARYAGDRAAVSR